MDVFEYRGTFAVVYNNMCFFLAAILLQATWWTMGVPILFTSALTACSLNPVTTVVIQDLLHMVSGLLLSVSSVAVDVNLEALLQEPLCDISCETIMHMVTARVCAPRGLKISDAIGIDYVLIHFPICLHCSVAARCMTFSGRWC